MNNQQNINPINITKYKELDFGTISLRSDDILTFEPTENITTLNKDELEIMLNELLILGEGKPKPFFSNNKQMQSLGTEEREFIGSTIHQFASKSAIIENSPMVRFITHMIVHFYKPAVPMKMFKKETDAIEWLKQSN